MQEWLPQYIASSVVGNTYYADMFWDHLQNDRIVIFGDYVKVNQMTIKKADLEWGGNNSILLKLHDVYLDTAPHVYAFG